jgi:pre-mRNA-splicing factor ATP-dependent RNA helicase DHX16
LNASGLPDSAESRNFINEVYSRAPRKSKKNRDSAVRQAEKDAKALKAQKYSFVLEDDAPTSDLRVEDLKKGKKDRKGRKREAEGRQWEDDPEEQARKRLRAEDEERLALQGENDEVNGAPMETEEEAAARREQERKEDLRERDAFAERVRERDKEKTKKLVEDRSSKRLKGEAAEAALRRELADDADARNRAMPNLRERSRQEYLKKREIQRVELLKQEIADEEAMFRGMRVTKKEQEALERRKMLLRVIEERLGLEDHYDGYQLPDDYITEQGKIDKKKKESVLYKRYEENTRVKDDQFVTDVDQWEASQTRHSTFKTGALDKPELVEEYDYVFDESQTIAFVMDQTMGGEGMMSEADKLLKMQIDEAEKRGRLCSPNHSRPY